MAGDETMSRDALWVSSMQESLEGSCLAERLRHRADTIYLLVMAGRIIAMQSGFAMLEAAFVRPMNAANIMMKNLMDMFLGCVVFYLFGYQLAFGEQVASMEEKGTDWALWFLQFSYATTAATIDSGALAGRVSFVPYVVLSAVMTGLIYPTVVQWIWGGGWVQNMGFLDFAGGVVVHLVGAVSALVCICVCGPRIGRFPEYRTWRRGWRVICVERNTDEYYRGPQTEVERRVFQQVSSIHNPVQALFGVFLLLVGFLAFNPASTFSTTDSADLVAARASATTLLMTAGAAVTSFPVALCRRRSTVITIPEFATMTVAGMVASCGCCNVVPPWLSMPIGVVAAILADLTQHLLNRMQLDDVVGAVAAHGPPGAWGVLCVPIFAAPHCQSDLRGLAFGGGSEAWELLGVQVAGVLATAAFASVSTYITVIAIDLLVGFRSNRAIELIGHDYAEHAYEDGSVTTDPYKATVMKHSPVRDCVKERIIKTSRSSSNGNASDEVPELTEPPAAGAGSSEAARVERLEREVRSLREDVRLMSTMLYRGSVNNSVFSSTSERAREASAPREASPAPGSTSGAGAENGMEGIRESHI